jgi:hypothetical protein
MRRTASIVSFGVLACCLMPSMRDTADAAAPNKNTAATQQISLQVAPGQQLAMELPTGLCHLDPKRSEAERILITQFERHYGHVAKLMSALADCHKLKVLVSRGQSGALNHWGGVAAVLVDGKVRQLSGVTRSGVIEEIARTFASGQTEEEVRADNELGNRFIDSALKEAKSKASASANHQQSLGLLAKDEVAAFSGTLMKETVNGKSRMVSGVWGVTLVRNYVVMVTVYRAFVDRSTVDTLLSETRAALLSMILLNDKESFRAP